ncbi:SAM-dependent methyltransferase [Actinomadura vinacea]|uniref:SAM-dependent methyltransferase n=1 Tax=Actinomadura vinacea TaxID=115336 RepID=A0ABN3JN75_9ACTN
MTPVSVLGTGTAPLLVEDRGAEAVPAPSAARMYDYYLGGKDNYAPDRELADRVLATAPFLPRLVRANRAFLRHAARFLAERAGMRQFLDIGCGLPAPENLDDIVRRVDPSCRVAYADNDPLVLSHARALLAVDGNTDAFEADLRDPAALLAHPALRRLIDFDEPVAVLLMSVLHFVTDAENPWAIMDGLLAGLPPGSHVVISHSVRTPEQDAVAALYREADVPFTPRAPEAIAELYRDLEPVPCAVHPPGMGAQVPLACFVGRTSR